MSVVYRNWELGGGPTIGYTMGGSHNADSPPNLASRTQQDSLIRGLSALSLCLQSRPSKPSEQQDIFSLNDCLFLHSCPHEGLPPLGNARFLPHNYRLPALGAVSEERPWDGDSITTTLSPRADEQCPSTLPHVRSEGMEAQFMRKVAVEHPYSMTDSSPVKKGLSQFYSGKSRSYTCLADVTSVNDIAKPENPYSRKRKSFAVLSSDNSDRLNTLQNGAGTCKKPFHTNTNTLVLAVAMTTKQGASDGDENKWSGHLVASRELPSSSVCSRSYSLSDLQGDR